MRVQHAYCPLPNLPTRGAPSPRSHCYRRRRRYLSRARSGVNRRELGGRVAGKCVAIDYGYYGIMRARGRGVGEVGAPRGAIASTLQSSEEQGEEGDVAPSSLGPGASLATRSPRPECITCPCRRCRAPVGCTRIALYGVLGGLSVQMQASSRTRMSINVSSRASRARSRTG